MFALELVSCSGTLDDDSAPVGRLAQPLTDTDSDGMDDDWEVTHFGNLSATSAGDSDSDGMTNGEEYLHGFLPTVNDAFEDADGDRYPNVFEVRNGSDPNDQAVLPTPTFLVNGAGGGTHTTIGAALSAANVVNGAYQIIGIAPGVYTGTANTRNGVTITSTKPKLLFIGLEGAAETIIDGGETNLGWLSQNSAVISSLTFRKTTGALHVQSPAKEVRFVDLVVRDNTTPSSGTPGLNVSSMATGGKVYVVGSTFLDNTGAPTIKQININSGTATIVNTVVWSQTSGTMVAKAASATLITNNCLVKGQTLTGTGNLAGNVDPKLGFEGRLLWDSPLRGAGATVAQSRIDIDGELRPGTAPDIGVDQFNDSDSDELADQWEVESTGNQTTLTGRSQDGDGDGLSNEGEHANGTNPLVADTDGDGISDGDEVLVHGSNPLDTDTDDDDMPDGWEINHGLAPAVANAFDDDDGDRYPNVFEYSYSTDPSDVASTPTPTYLVNGAGGGTHTTIGAALGAANVVNGAYQIIGIAPGVYTGGANTRSGVTITSTKPKLLFIGLQGAAETVIDGDQANAGWMIQNSVVISSLTFRNTSVALYVQSPAKEVRFVDLIVRDNTTTSPVTPGLYVSSMATSGKVYVVGSVFLDNTGAPTIKQININAGAATLVNTVVWSQTSGTMVAKAASATLTTNHCVVKGQTLTGAGNLAGNVDPKLLSDGHLLWDSPLRGAGATVAQSRIDIDGELRPSTAPDIGVDQFNDSDNDELADQWEVEYAGNLTTLTGRSQDGDGDGLSNEGEVANGTNPLVADTDGDGISDGDEVLVHGSNPLSADTDGDDMPDGWEITHGLAPAVANAFDDDDGDRYPNVFEYSYSTDPSDDASTPTPTYLVNGAGGGTHATIGAALSAANVAGGPYQIIGLGPGVYTGTANLGSSATITSTKPKLLFIGLEGAAETIIDGGQTYPGWSIENSAVISSLTFRNTSGGALRVRPPAKDVHFVDLIVRDNTSTTPTSTAGLDVLSTATGVKVYVVGSTFVDNTGAPIVKQININAGEATLVNTVVWSETSGTMVAKGGAATLTTNNCLVKGQTLTGTGNLAGSVDPKLRSDARLRTDSPLRGAGGSVPHSRFDMDGELRPSTAPDIGVDQFNDSDGDGLPDAWEIANVGNMSATIGSADDDDDQLSNSAEYDRETDWLDPDTDKDGVIDGVEVALGTSPFVADAEELSSDFNQDGLIDSIGVQLGYGPHQLDSDGDSVSNADEMLMGTNSLRADSDGDGVPDGTDPFPLDHLVSTLPSDPQDVGPPVITLTAPWYAVEQMIPGFARPHTSRETIMQRIISIAGLLACAVATNVLGCSGSPDSSMETTPVPADVTERTPHDPTVPREPKQSKSLTLSTDWQPPAPTRTLPAHPKARVVPAKNYGVPTPTLGVRPSDAELRAFTFFREPLLPVPGTSSDVETEALAVAFREASDDNGGIEALARFTEVYPQSRWAPGIHLNLGGISYYTGYFQDALAHWKAAWELAKAGEDGTSQQIANQALAEYARMNARLGRMTELEELLEEAQSRTFMGDARVKIGGAAEGLWTMQHRPGVAFLCGPYALSNVAQALSPDSAKKATAFVEKIQSPVTGFSVSEVYRMSVELGLDLQIARREPGAPVIIPAVVHWKLGHFGALVRGSDARFLLQDPTFRNDIWLGRQALDREASGVFLVPAGALPSGWTRATAAEVSHLYGKGFTDQFDEDATGDDDHDDGGDDGKCKGDGPLPMATYKFHTLLASLHIEDTPVGYAAAVGPDVRVRVAYNQREANQPSTMDFTNFGPQFVSNWVSYLTPLVVPIPVGPQFPPEFAFYVFVRKRGGGGEVYSGFSSEFFFPESERHWKTGSVLHRLTANTYKKVYPDGRQEFYEQYIGTGGKVFLTRVVDPQGNEVVLEYDSTYPTRIHQIVDATGLPTVFHYDHPSNPYLVTSIEDPFGREGTFAYTLAAGQLRLQSIEDPYGIVSAFTYSEAGEIVAMTTPYGTTTFNLSEPFVNTGQNLIRYVEATDPLGQKERVEFNISTALTGVGPTLEAPLPSTSVVNFTNNYQQYRNSYFWDKLPMELAPGNYQKAHRYHWAHGSTGNSVTGVLESEVPPLEGRIFYNYPGQTQTYNLGTLASPSVVARVVKDAQGNNQTQATKYEYNTQANVTRVTDPMGRETLYEYNTNGIDVVAVKQRTGTSGGNPVWTTMASYAYGSGAPPHRPSSVTDGAGKTTQYTYSPTGQILTITNAKSEVTTFTYETNTSSVAYGRLLSITGDVAGGNRAFTYDTYSRMATSTDSEGYTLTYDYDALDRVRTITYPDATYEQYEYDDHSLVATRDREGRWTRHMYNPLRERVVTQDPELRNTQFQWCRCGELRRFVDGNGNITEWQRDERSRVTKKIHPNASFETYTYDFSGRLQTEVDPMARTTTYAYTVDDRIAKKDYSDTATPDVTYAYDAWYPRLASRVDGAGTTTFTYHPDGTATNGAGQVALVNGPVSNDTLKRTYDELGRLKKLEIVDDATQTAASYSEEWTFDARSRPTVVQNNLGSTTYSFVGQSNRPATVDYPNGMQTLYDYVGATGDFLLEQIKNISAGPSPTVISQFDYTYRQDRAIDTWKVDQGSGATTWTFGYDGARQLTSATRRDATPTVLESLAYGYDKAGNRTQVGAGTTAPRNFEVNALNQLLSERDHGRTTFSGFVDEPATVTVNGKPAKMTSTAGAAPFKFEARVDLAVGANMVVVEARDGNDNVATKTYSVTTTGASKTYEYDGNGNLRYEKQPNGTVIREYRWDQQNRLVRMLSGTHESVYDYDGWSRRVRITEKENSVQTKQETFIWCGARICQKRSGSTVVRSYFGQGFEQGSDDYFYTRDHLGSVREVMASDGTTATSRVSYDPWGKPTESGAGALTDFGFTGHYLDRPSGLNLPLYRGYSPSLGRWLSRDPIGIRGGFNLYGYVLNDPVDLIDPDGRVAFLAIPAVYWVAAGGLAFVSTAYATGVLKNPFPVLFQAAGSSALSDSLSMAKKHDVAQVDEIVRRYGLDREQRRRLHDMLQKEKAGRHTVELEEIEQLAEEIVGDANAKNSCE